MESLHQARNILSGRQSSASKPPEKWAGKAAEVLVSVLLRLGVSECGFAVKYLEDSCPYSSNSTGQGSVPHIAHRSGQQRMGGRKKAQLKVMPKIKGRDDNNTLPSCLLVPCPNLSSFAAPRSAQTLLLVKLSI